MNPFGCGPPAPGLRGRRKRGSRAPEAADRPTRPTRPGRGRRAARGPSPRRNRGGTRGPLRAEPEPPDPGAHPPTTRGAGPHPEPTECGVAPADARAPATTFATAPAAAARGGDMQMSQRSLQRRAAQAQVHPAPWRACAGGRGRALRYRRATCFFRAEAPKAENFPAGGAGNPEQPGESGRDTAAAHLFAFLAFRALAATLGPPGRGPLGWGRPRRGGANEPARLRRPEGARGGAASDRREPHLSHVAAKTG